MNAFADLLVKKEASLNLNDEVFFVKEEPCFKQCMLIDMSKVVC